MLRQSSRSAALALILLTMWAVLRAQTAPTDEPASVTGSVNNSVTGGPILRSHVVLRPADSGNLDMNLPTYGALTNGEGKFTISRLPSGRYSVSADRIGFVMPSGGSAVRSLTLTLAPGEKKADLDLVPDPDRRHHRPGRRCVRRTNAGCHGPAARRHRRPERHHR